MSQRQFPAEWAPQAAIMLTWPHAHSDWRPWLAEADATFLALAVQISRRQNLLVACRDAEHRDHVLGLLGASLADLRRVRMYLAPSNDTWVRDHGPLTVLQNGKPLLLDFQFNGWGGKFDAALDNQLTARLHQAGAFGDTPLEPRDLILEGGSVESDGQGALLTTRACLLSQGRNDLEQADMEAQLRETLGVERFLWLDHGHLAGDDTDSHIDTLARFCDPQTITYQGCDDPQDEHYADLQAMAAQLRDLRTPEGAPYRLVALPFPRPIHDPSGRRLPAGYANFLIMNDAVLVPVYGDPVDRTALEALGGCFPGREIVPVDCSVLIRQYGSLHCVTMQLPAGVLP